MTDQEINVALAKAIGWPRIRELSGGGVSVRDFRPGFMRWTLFDYKDEVVAFRLAESYNLFPRKMATEWAIGGPHNSTYADTAKKAIAMAVIDALTGESR